MKVWEVNLRNKSTILTLGPESDGNFSFYKDGKVYFVDGFGNLLEEGDFSKFKQSVLDFIKKSGKPDIIASDLHPLFHTTSWGKELANKFGAEFVQVQHHLAHIFSAVGEYIIQGNDLPNDFLGIACDGTGYGFDGKIWGGEFFEFSSAKEKRVGYLENQTLIGGELAIKEPARILISILGKFLGKDEVYGFVKDFYGKNEYELLYNQWKEGFNCLETSSTGRVLDAVSVFLGFSGNERAYKHAPIESLEKNSTESYEIEPEIKELNSSVSRNVILGTERTPESKSQGGESDSEQARTTSIYELQTTPFFEYLVENIDKDKKKLAATAQMYIAKGLWDICTRCHPEEKPALRNSNGKDFKVFFAGGVANNKIISEYLTSKGVIVSEEVPRGDAGISFGQLIYYLMSFRT